MQILPETDVAALLDRLVEDQVPGRRGLKAWRSLLRAHATLMRRLDTDLQQETGLALADYDVLAQLADEGLLRRDKAGTDARGVVVALTQAGIARLGETAPVHARGISKLFVDQLDDQELALLERALNKVIVDCSFG